MIKRDLPAEFLGDTPQRRDSSAIETVRNCVVARLNQDARGHNPSMCPLETSSGRWVTGTSVFCQKELLTFVMCSARQITLENTGDGIEWGVLPGVLKAVMLIGLIGLLPVAAI